MRYSKIILLCVVAGALVSCGLHAQYASPEPIARPERVQRAIEKVKPAIVRIEVVETSDRQGRKVKREAAGSGVIISPDGYVVTNHHVAGKAEYVLCTLADRQRIEADIVGTDALTDTTILRLRNSQEYPYAVFGDSSALQVGDEVLALGSPMALSQSVTRGIVSNTELVMPRFTSTLYLNGEDVGSVVRWIGHDAAIYSGNSGGPLINLDGEIIGINEIKMGLGGAIPGNLVQEVASQIMDKGYIQRSWFGFHLQPLLRTSDIKEGVLLSGTIQDSPAYKAGFKAGDILLAAGKEKLSAQFAEELPLINKTLLNFPVGEKVRFSIIRNGEKKTLSVVPEERERRLPGTYEAREWGFTYRELSRYDVVNRGLDKRTGILVTTTRPGGAAADAKPDIQSNDLILQINNEDIKNRESFITITERLMQDIGSRVPVLVKYQRDGEISLTVVELGERDLIHSPRTVTRAWLPFETQVLTRQIARQKGMDNTTGVRITRIYQNLLNDDTDLRVGDIIVALDGDSIPASSDPEDRRVFINMVRQYRVDSDIELTFFRNGEKKTASITTLRSPLERREMERYENLFFEFTLREISPLERMQKNWDEDMKGVIVDEVVSGSWAALGNIEVGDVIKKINKEPVYNIEVARKILQEAEDKKMESIILKVLRGRDTLFLEIIPDWDDQ